MWWRHENLANYLTKILHKTENTVIQEVDAQRKIWRCSPNIFLASVPNCKYRVREYLKRDVPNLLPSNQKYKTVLATFFQHCINVFALHCLVKFPNLILVDFLGEIFPYKTKKGRGDTNYVNSSYCLFLSKASGQNRYFVHVSIVSVRVLVRAPTRSTLLIWWIQLQEDSIC